MNLRRGFGWYPPPAPPPPARPSRYEQRVRACEQAIQELYAMNGLGHPTVESYLRAGSSRFCRDAMRDVWPECARRAARDAARETGVFWTEIYLAACERVGVSALTGQRPRRH